MNPHRLISVGEDHEGPERYYCVGCLRQFRFFDEGEDSECGAVPMFGDA